MPKTYHERLIIFTRYPEPGKTKTRLIPVLGERGAADLQRRMTEHIVSAARGLLPSDSMSMDIHFDGGHETLMQSWLGPDLSYRPQARGNIGQRMRLALDVAFGSGADRAVVIGTDVPGISKNIIRNAFERLQRHDLVLGPARDGGYYLIGVPKGPWPRVAPILFENIAWGTEFVLSQTLAASQKMGLRHMLLETLNDVDRPEDLEIWHRQARKAARPKGRITISIIMPALNEADCITTTLATLTLREEAEIIVVDGGSRDSTPELAKSYGARVLKAAPSKSGQMNTGAKAAVGDILLFLHADTRLPGNFEASIGTAIYQDGVAAGAFQLRIDSESRGLRFIEKVANWRSRRLQAPYGDQAIFVTRSLFQEIGGYPDMPIMEDFELIRRLRRRGRIIILDQFATTSPRRWQNLGILKTWLLNQTIAVAYIFGCPPQRLAKWYRREKGKFLN
jgi:rSAM/selenodomain-associated transferase 2/rSAM/selenodomain-associated transferase 1